MAAGMTNLRKDNTDNPLITDASEPLTGYGDAISPRRHSRFIRVFFFTLKISITVFLLTVIIHKIQPQEIRADWQSVNGAILALGLLMTIPNLLVQHLKWRYLARLVDPAVTHRDIFRSLLCGFSIGLITPGRLGEMGRGWFLESAAKPQMIGMGIIDKILSLMALSLISVAALAGMVVIHEFPFTVIYGLLLTLAGLFMAFMLIIIFSPNRIRYMVRNSKRAVYRLPWRNKLFALLSAVDNFKRKHFLPAMSYALLFQVIVLMQYYVILSAFSEANPVSVMALSSLAFFGKAILPVAVMDLGVREGALIYFLSRLSVPVSSVFNASIFLFLTNVLLPGIVGSFFFIYNLIKKKPS